MELQQYAFTIEHRSGKANANADALSRMYGEEDEVDMINCFMVETEYDAEESELEDKEKSNKRKRAERSVSPATKYLRRLGPAPGESDNELISASTMKKEDEVSEDKEIT